MHSNTDTIPKYRPRGAIPIPIPARGGVRKWDTTLVVERRRARSSWYRTSFASSNCFHSPKEINYGWRPQRASQAKHRLGRADCGPSKGNVQLVGGEWQDACLAPPSPYGIHGLHARDVHLLLGPGPVPQSDQLEGKVAVVRVETGFKVTLFKGKDELEIKEWMR
jgi:hypothetical protein